ncbi:hypothetical protein [Ekhidna sp.]|uniref:hypothetical protein n=1 Tax=Ekhidna sp. TaxID=2608089 RepID=UPI003CCC427E
MENKNWILTSSITGCLSLVSYTVALIIDLDGFIWHLNSFSIGVLLGIALYSLSKSLPKTVLSDVGGILSLTGGIFMSYMLMLQHGMVAMNMDYEIGENMQIYNYIQLSTDIAFDFFIGIGLILLCIQMIKMKGMIMWLGIIGLITQVLQIFFNLSTFPINPGLKGYFDVGPLAAVWLLILFVGLPFFIKRLNADQA